MTNDAVLKKPKYTREKLRPSKMIARDLIFRTSKYQQTIKEQMEMAKVESFEEQNHVFDRAPAV